MSNDDSAPWWETAVDVLETLGALVACVGLVSLPLWFAILVALMAPALAMPAFSLGVAVVVVFPALMPIADRPELDAPRRWGTRMGRLLGAPLRWSARRRAGRSHRALGAATSTSSTASPSLPPRS